MTLFLHGRDDFPFGVIGVSQHGARLGEIVAAQGWTAPRQPCIATLILARGKPYEKNRVAVEIAGGAIGYCPSYLATRFLEWAHRWHFGRATVRCRAMLIAGDGMARPEVRLDIELPFKVTRL
jgi:hypothetical protein